MTIPCIQGEKIWELTTQQALNHQSLITMNEKLDDLKNSVDEIKTNLLFLINKNAQEMQDFKEKADKNYSGKWVEKLAIWWMTIIWTTLLGAVLTLILK